MNEGCQEFPHLGHVLLAEQIFELLGIFPDDRCIQFGFGIFDRGLNLLFTLHAFLDTGFFRLQTGDAFFDNLRRYIAPLKQAEQALDLLIDLIQALLMAGAVFLSAFDLLSISPAGLLDHFLEVGAGEKLGFHKAERFFIDIPGRDIAVAAAGNFFAFVDAGIKAAISHHRAVAFPALQQAGQQVGACFRRFGFLMFPPLLPDRFRLGRGDGRLVGIAVNLPFRFRAEALTPYKFAVNFAVVTVVNQVAAVDFQVVFDPMT